MATIYDNIEANFEDGLKKYIESPNIRRADFCVGYFNLRGWNLIVNHIENIPGDYVDEEHGRFFRTCRLLIGMHSTNKEYIKILYSREENLPDAAMVQRCKLEIARDFKRQLLWGLPSKKDEWTLRRLSTQLKSGKVVVKLHLREPLHAKLYIMHKDDFACPCVCIMGSSNLTYAGLTKQGELNAAFSEPSETDKFCRWFTDRWDDRFCIDISKELIEAIDNSWAAEKIIPPYYIYLKVAYHLSEEARNGIKEFTLTREFRKELFEFQQNAVKIAARYLNNDKRGGAIIGDVVGLGKTITACAIAKIFEMTYASSTLIVCPANLQEMWKQYVHKYDLKADVVSIAKPIDVDSARYYRLIIVDESHNLRNGGIRYQNVRRLIEHQSCKVLLLTATPYNKDFSDLSTQLKLFVDEGHDLGIRPEVYIKELGGERAFLQKHGETFIRSIKAFEHSTHIEDWNELMRLFLVRRTRSFVKQNFAKEDSSTHRRYLEFSDGKRSYFPDRLPRAIKFTLSPKSQYHLLYSPEMLSLIHELQLPRYGLSKYIREEKTSGATKVEQKLLENLSRAGQRMMGFCLSTFFKRIDSSGFSFLLTVYRHILRNCIFIHALENGLPVPIGDENSLPDDYCEDDDSNIVTPFVTIGADLHIPDDIKFYLDKAEEYYNLIANKGNVEWLPSTFFKRTLKQALKRDCETLIRMILYCGDWQHEADEKLSELENLLANLHPSDKVLVFTQYSDTARYIYNQLKRRNVKALDVVTGDSEKPSAKAARFSPISNGIKDLPVAEQTRVLVATDVLSEGHNLQDAHIVVNYDLPWAIIRLIQRAGRVDRIGQSADKIFCYSFFPAEGVENIIRLRERLNNRINENASIVGSDEVFFEGNEQNLRDLYNERSGILDDADDSEVDLSSQAYQIWKSATDANPALKDIIPNLPSMIYSTKAAESPLEDGVVTYVRTANDFDMLTWLDGEGKFVTQSQKKVLDALRCSIDTPSLPAKEQHHDLVAQAIEHIKSENTNVTSGILGSRFSTRRRVIELLENQLKQPLTLFFTEESREQLKLAIDDIYNFPLQEQTAFMLGRMLRSGKAVAADIVEYVLEMRKAGSLCRKQEDNGNKKEHNIICSMGMTYNEQP